MYNFVSIVHLYMACIQVFQLEKDVKLKEISLKEAQKDLETEKAFSSKIYDDVCYIVDILVHVYTRIKYEISLIRKLHLYSVGLSHVQ